MRGIAVTEERIALVIGNAAYRNDPLDNPVNDARLIGAGAEGTPASSVSLRENLDRPRPASMRCASSATQLNENTIAVLYYAGHGLQLRDRNYLIPVDAEIRSEDEIPLAGVDLGFVLGRMSTARSRINIVILDACRNNPFAGKGGHAPRKAWRRWTRRSARCWPTPPRRASWPPTAAAPTACTRRTCARHLLTPGLPVEHVFKRVREGVVRDTREQQVPWESSSLQGEFAFVPGVAARARSGAADIEAAGELAFWNSIQASNRADEYRAYLRQYPSGRFAALAQMRGSRPSRRAPAAAPPAAPAAAARRQCMPRVGDTWRYRVQDQFRLGDLFVTAKVDAVSADGVAEILDHHLRRQAAHDAACALAARLQPAARLGR